MEVGIVDRQKLVNIADAVREKTGIIFDITLDEIASNISSMPTSDNNANFDFSWSRPLLPGSSIKLLSYLTKIDLSRWDTSNITNMGKMFSECYLLTSLDLSGFDTSMVTNMSNMFNGCESLESLDMSGFDTSKVTNMNNMFKNCSKLSNLTLGTDWASNSSISSFDLSSCPLTHESAVDVINKLATRKNSPVITFSEQVELYQSEIDIATNKGWSVSGCSLIVEDPSTAKVGQYALIDGVMSMCVYVADTPQDWGQRVFASQSNITYSNGRVAFEWGGYGTATGITATKIGKGLANTNSLIAMNLQSSDGSPTIWDALKEFRTANGDRWFIPSVDEGVESFKQGMVQMWTSSEYDSNNAYETYDYHYSSKEGVGWAYAFTYV